MTNQHSFSIVCPIYNAEKTLLECVASIQKQTYSDWELVLVDDGSIDNSGKIIDDLAKKDHRIKAIHKKNEGQAKARLVGVDNASGDYILFLDSDDQYELNSLEEINKALCTKNADMLVYNANAFGKDGRSRQVYSFNLDQFESPLVECFVKRRISYFWSSCFKKEIFDRIDPNIKDTFARLRYSEDFYLIYNIVNSLNRDKFSILDKTLYKYIANSNSITNNQNASKLMDRFFVFNYVFEDIHKKHKDLFKRINKVEKDVAGWSALSAARKVAVELNKKVFLNRVKVVRHSFLFKHLSKYKKDKYNLIGYILLKMKMYRKFRKYIIKHEGEKHEN